MTQKTALITGSTASIGLETAIALSRKGYRVLLTGRNPEKGAKAVATVKQKSWSDAVEYYPVDFTLMEEVKQLAAKIAEKYPVLDVLINNSGDSFIRREETAEGLEKNFAMNHLSPFILTLTLLPNLQAAPSARIVNVSSAIVLTAPRIDLTDLQSRSFTPPAPYGRAKLANLSTVFYLAGKLKDTQIAINLADPGVALSEAYDRAWKEMHVFSAAILWPTLLVAGTPKKAARCPVYLATSSRLEGITGKYYNPYLKLVPKPAPNYNPKDAAELFQQSLALSGLSNPFR